MDRLVVDISADGWAGVSHSGGGEPIRLVSESTKLGPLLDSGELEDLRWYLEEYLGSPFGVYGDRGSLIASRLPVWGDRLFEALLGDRSAREAYEMARRSSGRTELVVRSASSEFLAIPWELMHDPVRQTHIALDRVAVTRSMPGAEPVEAVRAEGSRLRILMVISRPGGLSDVGYHMIARPMLPLLERMRGAVEFAVLRPPTLQHLEEALTQAAEGGVPFHLVNFDGHGVVRRHAGGVPTGMLAFERPGGGWSDLVEAAEFARVLTAGRVPLVVLNACHSGQIGGQAEAAIATSLLKGGAISVIAMAYSVYAVAAAEFMAAFYGQMLAGNPAADAVAIAREGLAKTNERPSPRGKMPLADWMVPVHYSKGDVHFPQLNASMVPLKPAGEGRSEAGAAVPGPAQDHSGRDNDRHLAASGAFVGRDGLFYSLEAAVMTQRVILLHGLAGAGKSELAKAFGRWWRDTGGAEGPELIFWHSFRPGGRPFSMANFISGIGCRIDGPGFAGLPPDQQRLRVHVLLERHRALLIWDDFEVAFTMPDPAGAAPPLSEEDRAELRAFLSDVQETSISQLLLTSRTSEEWLGDIHRIEVERLTPGEAVDYADRLLAAHPGAQARRAERTFGEFIECLDGNPLTIRLIVPLLDGTDPQVLADSMQDMGRLPGDGSERTSLTGSIFSSFAHLPPGDQDALTALALFRRAADTTVLGVFSGVPQAPGHLQGHDRDAWAEMLDRAAALGLLSRQRDGLQGIYRMHPALPGYLMDLWRARYGNDFDQQYDAAIRSLLYAFQFLARMGSMSSAEQGNIVALAVIETNQETLDWLLIYAIRHQMWAHAEFIIRPLSAFWNIKGMADEAGVWVARVKRAIEEQHSSVPDLTTPAGRLRHGLIASEATRQLRAGYLDAAERGYHGELHLLQQSPDTPDHRLAAANMYHQLGRVAQERGQWDQADSWYRQSLVVFEESGDRSRMAAATHQLGNIAYLRGAAEDARRWYRQSLDLDQETGDRPGMKNGYHQLSVLASQRGRWSEAQELSRRSLALAKELGDRPGIALSYGQLGAIAQDQGQWEQAETWYRHCLAIEEQLGDQPGIAKTFHNIGAVAYKQDRQDEADSWFRRSLALYKQLGDRLGMAKTYHNLGVLAGHREMWAEAEAWSSQALALAEELGNHDGLAGTYHQLGILAYLQGRWDEADSWYHRSLAVNEQLGNRPGMANTCHQLGMLAHRREQWTEAEAWYRRALAIKQELSMGSLPSTYNLLARLALQQGDKLRALDWLIELLNPHGRYPRSGTEDELALVILIGRDLGLDALESVWQNSTGTPLPVAVRALVETDAPGNDQPEGTTNA